MLKISGYEIFRGGTKVGYIDGDRVRAHDGKILGFFSGNYVYDMNDHRIAYIDGNYLCSEGSMSMRVPLDKVNETVVGGVLPEIGKCAVYVLIGV